MRMASTPYGGPGRRRTIGRNWPPQRVYSLPRALARSAVEWSLAPCQQGRALFLSGVLAIISDPLFITSYVLIVPTARAPTGAFAGRKTAPFRAWGVNLYRILAVPRYPSSTLDAASLIPKVTPLQRVWRDLALPQLLRQEDQWCFGARQLPAGAAHFSLPLKREAQSHSSWYFIFLKK